MSISSRMSYWCSWVLFSCFFFKHSYGNRKDLNLNISTLMGFKRFVTYALSLSKSVDMLAPCLFVFGKARNIDIRSGIDRGYLCKIQVLFIECIISPFEIRSPLGITFFRFVRSVSHTKCCLYLWVSPKLTIDIHCILKLTLLLILRKMTSC